MLTGPKYLRPFAIPDELGTINGTCKLEDNLSTGNLKRILGEDIINYLRAYYADPRGLNIRNIICHGAYTLNMINAAIADRIFHTLLCLAAVRENTAE